MGSTLPSAANVMAAVHVPESHWDGVDMGHDGGLLEISRVVIVLQLFLPPTMV